MQRYIKTKSLTVFTLQTIRVTNLFFEYIGSFGLHFDGVFSQPARFVHGYWETASDYLMPLDREMKLPYLEKLAEYTMNLGPTDLPPLVPYQPCSCKPKFYSIDKH